MAAGALPQDSYRTLMEKEALAKQAFAARHYEEAVLHTHEAVDLLQTATVAAVAAEKEKTFEDALTASLPLLRAHGSAELRELQADREKELAAAGDDQAQRLTCYEKLYRRLQGIVRLGAARRDKAGAHAPKPPPPR